MRKPPGPVRTSCMTCKRRRKKCDRRKPTCGTCEMGGLECLGYLAGSSPEESPWEQGHQWRHLPSIPQAVITAGENSHLLLGLSSLLYPQSSEGESPQASAYGLDRFSFIPPNTSSRISNHCENTAHSYLGAEADCNLGCSTDWGSQTLLETLTLPAAPLALPPILPITTPAPHTTQAPPRSGSLPEGSNRATSSSFVARHPTSAQITSYMRTLPRGLPPLPTDITRMIDFILTQYDRFFSLSYFDPMLDGAPGARISVTQRAFSSSTTRCVMFLGAKIVDSFLDGTLSAKSVQYNHWVKRLEEQSNNSTRNLTYDEAQTRVIDTLELEFYKVRLTDQFHPRQLLRNLGPVFLQLVSSDPTLWPRMEISPLVSLPHIIASGRQELNHFIMLDILCSMTYGLPQMIEYDTVSLLPMSDKHTHGFPTEFQIILADINSRFHNYLVYDWRNVEQRILAWQSPVCATSHQESWKTIAQLAVHESWRQTLLIYLYMTICNATSDEPRVQSSVRQVFQLIDSARSPHPPSIEPHFFIQYVIAGACAQSEKQRALARERLSSPTPSRMWLLQGSDYVLVLDHLWHGAAANGQPIRWSDYIASRQIALPTTV